MERLPQTQHRIHERSRRQAHADRERQGEDGPNDRRQEGEFQPMHRCLAPWRFDPQVVLRRCAAMRTPTTAMASHAAASAIQ